MDQIRRHTKWKSAAIRNPSNKRQSNTNGMPHWPLWIVL